MNPSSWRFCGGLAAAALTVGLSGCGGSTAAGPETTSHAGAGAGAGEAAKPVPVTVAPLEHRTIERTVDVIGSLRGWEQVTVGSKRAGRVIKVHHDMGDHVAPGEPLVELDPIDAQLERDEADSRYLSALVKLGITRKQAEDSVRTYGIGENLLNSRTTDEAIARSPAVVEKRVAREKAQQNLARQRTLTQRGAGTAQELENAENDYRGASAAHDNAVVTARTIIADAYAARVALRKAEQSLNDLTIRAPQPRNLPPSASGSAPLTYGVTKRDVSEGQILKEGEAVAELVIEDPLRLWTQVPEINADSVHVGQDVRVTTRAHPDMTFDGRVARISPSVAPTSRTFQVETIVPNKRGLLRPGGLARASIIIDSHAQAVVVPAEALVRYAGVNKIFLVEVGKAKAVSGLQTGVEGVGWIEIVDAKLPESANVVTTGQTHLADGTPVVVRKPAEPGK
ncbi:MAG: efflux RND transporter periplasmic adaptor subunit [Isosphaeraceae bacterium]